jgi:hypothetical protein
MCAFRAEGKGYNYFLSYVSISIQSNRVKILSCHSLRIAFSAGCKALDHVEISMGSLLKKFDVRW